MVPCSEEGVEGAEKKRRRYIAVDETKLHGDQVYVWVARDAGEVLAVRVSYTRSVLDAELFLEQILRCENKPIILVDHEPRYVDALKSLA